MIFNLLKFLTINIGRNKLFNSSKISTQFNLGNLPSRCAALLLILCALAAGLTGCSKNKDNYQGLSAEQIYTQAQTNMKKENYADAIKDFEALEARYPYGEHSRDAQLALISAYHKKNESALALSAVDRFIRMNPRDPKVDYAYYLKGLINFDQNSTFMFRHLPLERSSRDTASAQESFDAFKDLIERFPNSEYVADARQRMLYLREQLASFELHVANYYLKRGAYLSAANRANYVLKNFPHTSAVPKALQMMVTSYHKLGMHQLAEEAEKTLETNSRNS